LAETCMSGARRCRHIRTQAHANAHACTLANTHARTRMQTLTQDNARTQCEHTRAHPRVARVLVVCCVVSDHACRSSCLCVVCELSRDSSHEHPRRGPSDCCGHVGRGGTPVGRPRRPRVREVALHVAAPAAARAPVWRGCRCVRRVVGARAPGFEAARSRQRPGFATLYWRQLSATGAGRVCACVAV
jgi:hypothetical protein